MIVENIWPWRNIKPILKFEQKIYRYGPRGSYTVIGSKYLAISGKYTVQEFSQMQLWSTL